MGSRNLVMVKTHIGSINVSFANGFVYENVLWALPSLCVFFCSYVLYSLGLILRYIFRFHVEDRKSEHLVPHDLLDQTKRYRIEDSKVDGFAEELANLFSVLKELEEEIEFSVLEEKDSDMHEDSNEREGEACESVFLETVAYVHEDVKKIGENETESFVFMEDDSNTPQDNKEKVEEEKTEESFFTDTDSVEASSLVEEPRILTFSFQQNYIAANDSDNIFSRTENIAKMEFPEKNLEKALVAQEEKEQFVQDERSITSNSTFGQIFQINAVGGSDSSNDDHLQHDNTLQYDFGSESCSSGIDDSDVMEGSSYCGEEECRGSMEKTKETMWEDNLDESDFDEEEDEDEDDFEWEHDEVLEQLKMELKNARQGGLATILEEEEEEETESPKVVEDRKPLKIEEKKEFKDHIVEIQKVYRCYAEKIRKLDVLNYQTMHAIGLLELKDPLKLMLIPKSTVQSAKPLSQNLWPRKTQKQISDPMLKFVQELHGDLELVYVGQVCLSWEILCWQHKRVQVLKQCDSQWPRSYNLVAGDFQLFQVLMQRFLEDEPFQGPRIRNYVKNRCLIRNLLQVPVIKEHAIDSERLEQIIKESMRVFWEFVRADKDYGNVIKVFHQTGIHVKDPAISDLLGNVRTQLQKKERKLKDTVRSGNCIVRKFLKHNEEQIQLDQEQLLAQVGLRLVSRVMHMKKLRKDQLMWCNEKLNRIKFDGRKVQVEPSFLFFPC
ncbi:hypothetical protein GmHk_07G020508 [Glycine max]|nr:hypothetical protein GmHk_07G020508 [Glycine max]